MNYILTNKSLVPSAKALADFLEIPFYLKPLQEPPLIRWGNVSGNYYKDTEHNSKESIRKAFRIRFSELLDKNGINTIKYFTGVPENYPVIVRTLLTSSEGKGIIICNDYDEWLNYTNYYWSPFINFSNEFGVHILGNKLVKIFRKSWNKEENEPEIPIRNAKKGYSFKRVNVKNYLELENFVESILKVFPISFGRLDIGYCKKDNNYYSIEFNCAPSLVKNQTTLELYGNYFLEIIENENNRSNTYNK